MRPKKTTTPRSPNTPLDPVRERYAGQRAMGLSQSAAFRSAKRGKKLTEGSVNACASRMEAEPEVKKRIAEINADMLKSSDAYLTKAQLAELLTDAIRRALTDPDLMSTASGLVDKYNRMFGFYEPERHDVTVGCLTEAEKNAKIARLLKVSKT